MQLQSVASEQISNVKRASRKIPPADVPNCRSFDFAPSKITSDFHSLWWAAMPIQQGTRCRRGPREGAKTGHGASVLGSLRKEQQQEQPQILRLRYASLRKTSQIESKKLQAFRMAVLWAGERKG